MPHDHKIIWILYFILPFFVLPSVSFPAMAQKTIEEPAVQIDMSVLDPVMPTKHNQHYVPPSAPAPARTLSHPSLIGPAKIIPRREKPEQNIIVQNAPPDQVPSASSKTTASITPSPVPSSLSSSVPVPARRPQRKEIKTFPIQVKDRTEQYDPSVKDVPINDDNNQKSKAVKKSIESINTPMPALKPVKTTPEQKIASAKKTKVPLPPRRPSIQRASENFVKKARHDLTAEPQKTDTHIKATIEKNLFSLSENKGAMPAIPAQKVQTEVLFTPKVQKNPHDLLDRQLITPDKTTMLKTIESIDATNITPITPPIINITENISKKTPRSPPVSQPKSSQLITISLSPEDKQIDENGQSVLQQTIIPLLHDHPAWRLQIKSFADSADHEEQNARRISLARALSARTIILDQGIDAQRIDIRVLGQETEILPLNRIDFVFFDPDDES